MSTTILQNLQNASKERDVSLEKVEEFLQQPQCRVWRPHD